MRLYSQNTKLMISTSSLLIFLFCFFTAHKNVTLETAQEEFKPQRKHRTTSHTLMYQGESCISKHANLKN